MIFGRLLRIRLIKKICRTVEVFSLKYNKISSFTGGQNFEEYSSSLDAFMSLTNSRIEELRGSMLTAILSFCSCTNSRFGGKLVIENQRTNLLQLEEKLLKLLTGLVKF